MAFQLFGGVIGVVSHLDGYGRRKFGSKVKERCTEPRWYLYFKSM
jgi:hypothetical protein